MTTTLENSNLHPRALRKTTQCLVRLLVVGATATIALAPLYSDAKPARKTTAKAGGVRANGAGRQPVLRLKRQVFPDVTMGIPAAYAVLMPSNWRAQGKIEWQPVGEIPFPQQKIEITSPQQGKISFEPLMTFTYTEAPGFGRQGVPAPANFPQWLAGAVDASDPKISNVKLVRATRDAKSEAFMKRIDAATGGGQGMQREVWIIVMDYDEAGVRRRTELNATYARFAPYLSANMNSQMWSIAPAGSISAPVNLFAAHRQALLNVANTLRPTPNWHTQSQAAIAEMSRQRAANNWAVIRERGRRINEMSDAQYAKYKKDMAGSEAAQHRRINSIYETDDFKDTNGNIVNLPIHYNHIFSDGKGNYVLSNSSQDRPGSAWKSIRPYK